MLAFIWFLLGILMDPTPRYEQLATDHFFDTIWKQKYQDFNVVEFDNKTDTSIHVGHIYGCEKWSTGEKKAFEKGKTKEQIQLEPKGNNIRIKKISNSNRLKLFIGKYIQSSDEYVVQIEVYKPYSFVNHYFIKFDKDGRIIDSCEFDEII